MSFVPLKKKFQSHCEHSPKVSNYNEHLKQQEKQWIKNIELQSEVKNKVK